MLMKLNNEILHHLTVKTEKLFQESELFLCSSKLYTQSGLKHGWFGGKLLKTAVCCPLQLKSSNAQLVLYSLLF